MKAKQILDIELKTLVYLIPAVTILVVMQLSALKLADVIYNAGHNDTSFLTYSGNKTPHSQSASAYVLSLEASVKPHLK